VISHLSPITGWIFGCVVPFRVIVVMAFQTKLCLESQLFYILLSFLYKVFVNKKNADLMQI
jgi:tetrahydromethanopterin S-methyltransferase subunit E